MKSTFNIYSASAGSGKTYTLAKSYLKLLVSSNYDESFRNILAITFTNKAVAEMKTRIITMLKLFSSYNIKTDQDQMFIDICEELSKAPETLINKSKRVLNRIIHNYGAFDISTIDGFTHKIIRTFALDLKLPINFEVELDQDYLLTKAIDALIAKAGTDKTLTKTLVDFAIEKADEDKSWDISKDFKTIGNLLLQENELPYINRLKEKTLTDFIELRTQIRKKVLVIEQNLVEVAKKTLTLIEESGLQFDDFNRKSIPNYFVKLSQKQFNLKYDAAWQSQLIEGAQLYPKRVTEDVANTINTLQPTLADAFIKTKEAVFNITFNNSVYKNITPLSVLTSINKELKTIKDEENKLLIAEFNTLISNEIKNQPTPFIYERLGEKFKHYFIDEFQDTSKMQWQNLIPLIDNALSAGKGSLMLVGDAKQSIYSWRGGDAEQFINLYNKNKNPFQLEPKINKLGSNYRSYKAIIDFNNSFFNFIANQFLEHPEYISLYNNAHQKVEKGKKGYVNLSFIDFNKKAEGEELYVEKTYNTIKSCLKNGYQLKDISVLVRKKKEGIAISNYLTEKNIAIISSETLLINNSAKVRLLNTTIELIINTEDQKLKLDFLIEISKHLKIDNKHNFYKNHINLSVNDIFNKLSEYNISLDYNTLLQMPIYELAESLVRSFNFCDKDADAYIQFYLDTVLEYSQKHLSDLLGFIEYFKSKAEKLSVSIPENLDAVSIMTIHKSKGLEFPVVIFPFADLDIYKEIEPKTWFPIDKKKYNGFSHMLLNYSKNIENFGTIGQDIHNNRQNKLRLDNINLLYVTLTRAIEKLYIITKKDVDKKGIPNSKTYAGLFINYLINENKWNEELETYEFGELEEKEINKNNSKNIASESYQFISTEKESHNLKIITNRGLLWDTDQEKAIEYGNIIHQIMSKIYTKNDIKMALQRELDKTQSTINFEELEQTINQIVNNKILSKYFSEEYKIYNEKEIITKDGHFLRPDRLAIKNNHVVIIDYKTGQEDINYKNQLDRYASVLKEMNYTIEKKLIVYTNTDIKIVEVK